MVRRNELFIYSGVFQYWIQNFVQKEFTSTAQDHFSVGISHGDFLSHFGILIPDREHAIYWRRIWFRVKSYTIWGCRPSGNGYSSDFCRNRIYYRSFQPFIYMVK